MAILYRERGADEHREGARRETKSTKLPPITFIRRRDPFTFFCSKKPPSIVVCVLFVAFFFLHVCMSLYFCSSHRSKFYSFLFLRVDDRLFSRPSVSLFCLFHTINFTIHCFISRRDDTPCAEDTPVSYTHLTLPTTPYV